jgi:aryl-alcohol dehydrogenase-like predicted oxidoreductase
MENYSESRILGRTGLKVGRLGVSGGYGAPAGAFEMAFERGCNYFYHGSLRRGGMSEAIRNLVSRGKRDGMVIVAQSYTRWVWQLRRGMESFLKELGLDYADVLLLGWHNSRPSQKIMDACDEMKGRGLFRHVAVSGHNRSFFPTVASDPGFGIFHIRYNAAHRGAEREVFEKLPEADRPGIVAYTATRWGKLVNTRGLPDGVPSPRASDAYRFVLSNPAVDVCMTGPKTMAHMKEALDAIDRGPMSDDELGWMRRVGDIVHRKAAN